MCLLATMLGTKKDPPHLIADFHGLPSSWEAEEHSSKTLNNDTSSTLLSPEPVVWAIIATEVQRKERSMLQDHVGSGGQERSNEDAARHWP